MKFHNNQGGNIMGINEIINSPGMWAACGIMVIVVVGQSILFLRKALKHAPSVGLTKDQTKSGIRASIITAIGPSFAPVLVLLSLVSVLGAPTTWMRMNDIGAPRTELAMAEVAVGVVDGELTPGAMTAEAFSAATWGMALNNVGWMLLTLFLTHRMSKALGWMNAKYNPKWIKLLMLGAAFGLFGYMTSNQIVGKAPPALVAVLAAGAGMVLINKFLGKYRFIREPALGICMIIGMAAASIYKTMIG